MSDEQMPEDTLVCRRCAAHFVAQPGMLCPDHGLALVKPSVDQANPQDRLLGRVIEGRFALIDVIGEGGFGAVYYALQLPELIARAVKVMHAQHARQPQMQRRFRLEGRTVARLKARSTVQLMTYGEEDGLSYMVLEYVAGQSLRDVLKTAAPLSVERTTDIAVQVLESLAEAHALGIVHRDIKPENLMLTRTPLGGDAVKVLDFGIAKLREPDPHAEDSGHVMTQQGHAVGSPTYMPVEQAQGRPEHTSDIYALGIMLYEMLTGAPPFRGTVRQRLMAHAREAVPELPPALPRALNAVIQTATAKAPTDRFASAASMARALRGAPTANVRLAPSGDAPMAAPEPTLESTSSHFFAAETDPPVSMRHPGLRGWLALAVVIIGLGVGLAIALQGPDDAGSEMSDGVRPAPRSVPVAAAQPVDSMIIDLPPVDAAPPSQPPIDSGVAAPASEAPPSAAVASMAPASEAAKPKPKRVRRRRPKRPRTPTARKPAKPPAEQPATRSPWRAR